MSNGKKLTEEQNRQIEYVKQGYLGGMISVSTAYAMLSEVKISLKDRLSWIETFAMLKGLRQRSEGGK